MCLKTEDVCIYFSYYNIRRIRSFEKEMVNVAGIFFIVNILCHFLLTYN